MDNRRHKRPACGEAGVGLAARGHAALAHRVDAGWRAASHPPAGHSYLRFVRIAE
jgi:hypothetical protein